jgi:tetratricopeptide (TPR) repeat protein
MPRAGSSRVQPRVVEIYVDAEPAGGTGRRRRRVASGYAIADDLVLTAGHVLDTCDEASRVVHVRPLGSEDWIEDGVTVAWHRSDGELDGALLRVASAPWRGLPDSGAVRWGVPGPDERVHCVAVGFPDSQQRPGGIRDTDEVAGRLSPGTRAKGGRLVVDVASPADDAGRSPWPGMSGAALLSASGRRLLGVIVAGMHRSRHRRLEATAAGSLLADPDFAAAAGHPPAGPVDPGEHRPLDRRVLREPYADLPARHAEVQLLIPRYGLVPFLGRAAELAGLETWCGSGQEFSVAVLTGEAGAGKSRLTAELSMRVREKLGWDAFFADPGLSGDISAWASLEPDWPLLLVFDYPELMTPAVGALASQLAARPRGSPKARLLLVSRQVGRWWGDLDVDTSGLLSAATDVRVALTSEGFGPADRERHARAAAAAFAERLELPRAAPPDVSSEAYTSPLLVHIAALLAVHGERIDDAAPGSLRDKLLGSLLDRERRRWRRGQAAGPPAAGTGPGLGLGDIPAHQAVTLATLTTPGRAECRELLKAVPDLADAPAERRGQIADWIAWLYPAAEDSQEIAPLQPDLVAGQLLATTPELTRLTAAITDQEARTPGHLSSMLQALRLAADHDPRVRQALRSLLTARLRVLLIAAASARSTGLPWLLNECLLLSGPGDPELAAAAGAEDCPGYPSLPSRIAVTVAELALAHHRSQASGGGRVPVGLARALTDLGLSLAAIGRPADAVAPLREAVGVARQGRAAESGRGRPDLARALGNLAFGLAEARRPAEAIVIRQEVAGLLGELARDDPAAYRLPLAANCKDLALDLTDAGQHEEAIRAAEQAVGHFTELAAADPGKYVPWLAKSLSASARALARGGRAGEALAASQRAVDHIRPLLADSAADGPDLFDAYAEALRNLSADLADAGRLGEAVAITEEAVGAHQRLAAYDPERYTPLLLRSLEILGERLRASGRWADSLKALEVAGYSEQVSRRAATGQPGDHRGTHAHDLLVLGLRRADIGDNHGACAAIGEAVTGYRELAADDPARYRPYLRLALHDLCIQRLAAEDAAGAVTAGTEAVDISRELTATWPGPAARAELAASLTHLGEACAWTGGHQRARDCLDEALAIMRALAGEDPATYLRRLAGTLNNVGMVFARAGRTADALPHFHDALDIHRSLARASPGGGDDAFAGVLHNLGTLFIQDGLVSQAVPLLEEAMTRFLSAAAAAAGNARLQRRLAATGVTLGAALRATGRGAEAARWAQQAADVLAEYERQEGAASGP